MDEDVPIVTLRSNQTLLDCEAPRSIALMTSQLCWLLAFTCGLLPIFNGPALAQSDGRGLKADRLRAECFVSVAQERYQVAVLACGAAIEADPANPEPYSNRGSASLFLQLPEDAVKDFTTAITLAPTEARNYFNRGIAYEATNLPSQAKDDYDTAIRLEKGIG